MITMIEEIIKVELSYQQRLVTLTETLIIPGTTKPNLININCIIIHCLEETLTKTMSQGTQSGIAVRNYALCTSPTE